MLFGVVLWVCRGLDSVSGLWTPDAGERRPDRQFGGLPAPDLCDVPIWMCSEPASSLLSEATIIAIASDPSFDPLKSTRINTSSRRSASNLRAEQQKRVVRRPRPRRCRMGSHCHADRDGEVEWRRTLCLAQGHPQSHRQQPPEQPHRRTSPLELHRLVKLKSGCLAHTAYASPRCQRTDRRSQIHRNEEIHGLTLSPPSGARGRTENVALELLVHNHPRFYELHQRVAHKGFGVVSTLGEAQGILARIVDLAARGLQVV